MGNSGKQWSRGDKPAVLMTRRPFRNGLGATLWDELLRLREAEGLTLARVRRLAPTLARLSYIHTHCPPSELRDNVLYSFLQEWLDRLTPPQAIFARAAFRGDEVAIGHRERLSARRAYIAKLENCSTVKRATTKIAQSRNLSWPRWLIRHQFWSRRR